MPAITGMDLAQDAFGELNVFLPGESPPPADGAKALRVLNDLLSELEQRSPFTPVVSRNRFPTTVNKGGPTNPYTIGIGGDFNVSNPGNQNSIVAANLVLTASVPNVRVRLGIYTDDSYDANAIPDLANSQPTGLYFSPTYQGDLGAISIWPVPTINTNDLELFIQQPVAQFVDLSTTYYVPAGWPLFLKYSMADRLQGPYGRTLTPAQQRLLMRVEGVVKRSTQGKLSDISNDADMFAGNRSTAYNILTGNGGA